MTNNHQILITQEETLSQTIDCLINHIEVNSQGAFTTKDLFNLLVRAASNNDSIENTSKTLKNCPSGRNIRYHLDKFNDFETLESQVNLALKSQVLPRIRKGKLKLAIDLNLIPYYGEPSEAEKPYIYRSQAKQGTCSFYAYATLYCIKKGKRLTLAIRGVRSTDTSVAIISYLLADVNSLNLDFRTLYLDRGFFSRAVIRWLKALKIPFMIPAIKTGKTGGIKQFLKGKRSYKTTYTMRKNEEDYVTFDLWIVCKYVSRKGNKKERKFFAYVVYKPAISLNHIYEDYRLRFGIETSYRIKNICGIKTTNKKPVIRLLFIGISFVLVNIWVNLLWRKVSIPRRGGRLILGQLFTFKQMLSFLRSAIDKLYEVVDIIYLVEG